MKISVDRKGYTEQLKISVYLHRKDIGKGEQLFEILYEPTESFVGYDIKNDSDKFKRYVDGQKTEYHAK